MEKTKKRISVDEQRQIMLEMLRFIDGICRKNDIQYSLIGGSLIGVVRHHGFIPWDDDVDIILTKENYEKLKKILDAETGRFQTLKIGGGGEYFNFLKLVDTKTELLEGGQKKVAGYGIYTDIFSYFPTAQNKMARARHFRKIRLIYKILHRRKLDFKNRSLARNIYWASRNTAAKMVGYNNIQKIAEKVCNKYVCKKTEFVVSNWPVYSMEKEIQKRKNVEEYIDAEFEGVKVMIFKNYDEILRTTFGDYMKLPPEEERVPKHNLEIWWREDEK